MALWEDILLPSLQQMAEDIAGILPNIVAALLVLLAGWMIAKGLASLSRRILQRFGFNSIAERAGITGFLTDSGFAQEPSWMVGKLVYWLIIFSCILAVADILQLTVMAATMQRVVAFIPNIIAVILIIVFGSLLARVLSGVVRIGASNVGIEFAEVLGKAVNMIILIMVMVMAFSQLEIESVVLEITFAAILGAFGLAIALTLGLGSRAVAQNILSGVYARKSFQIGQTISIHDHQGEVIQIGTVNTVLRTSDDKTVTVPNTILISEIAVSQPPSP